MNQSPTHNTQGWMDPTPGQGTMEEIRPLALLGIPTQFLSHSANNLATILMVTAQLLLLSGT